MTPAKTVLVPLDGSVHATAAMPVARRLAELFHATLAVLHVSDDALASAALVERMKLSSQDMRGLVVDQRSGAAAVSIVQAASERHAALIVMCPQTRMDSKPRVFGSVAEAVLRAARCPVVLVPPTRGHRDWALKQLLLPHDGTPTSAATIGPATQLASMAAAQLVVLHVATAGPELPTEPGTRATSTSPSTSGRHGRRSSSTGSGLSGVQRMGSTFVSRSLRARPAPPSSISRERTTVISSFWAGAVRSNPTARGQCGA